jgi:hypothetical protein
MEVFAAADHIDLDVHASAAPAQELKTLVESLARANPDEVEDRTYRLLKFDLCDECRGKFLADPLGG